MIAVIEQQCAQTHSPSIDTLNQLFEFCLKQCLNDQEEITTSKIYRVGCAAINEHNHSEFARVINIFLNLTKAQMQRIQRRRTALMVDFDDTFNKKLAQVVSIRKVNTMQMLLATVTNLPVNDEQHNVQLQNAIKQIESL